MKNLILSLAFLLFGSVSAFATNKESVATETFQKRVELVSDVKSSSVASVVSAIADAPVKQQVLEVVKSEDCDCVVIIIIIIIVFEEAAF